MPQQQTYDPSNDNRILLLEGDSELRRATHLMLSAHGFDVRSYAAPESLLVDPAIGEARYLVANFHLPKDDGIAVLRAIQGSGWAGRAVLITENGTPGLREAATSAGFVAVLDVPVRPHDLVNALRNLPAAG